MAAVNAAETAAEISKSTDAVKGLTTATEEQKKAVEEATDKDAAAATEAKQQQQINIERARTLQQVAEKVAMVGDAMQRLAEQVRKDSPEVADNLDMASGAATTLASSASMAAQGFAVGGPFGAAVGAVVGSFVPSIKSAFDDMTTSLLGAAASQSQLTENTRKLAEAQANFGNFTLATQLAEDFDKAKNAAAELLGTIRDIEAVEAAKKSTTKAQRDLEDQRAENSGEDPGEIKKRRIAADAEDERAALEANLQRKRDAAAAAVQAAQTAADNVAAAEAASLDPKEIAARRAEEDQARQRSSAAGDDFRIARITAPYQRGEITAKQTKGMEAVDQERAKKDEDMRNQHADDNIRAEIDQQKTIDAEAAKAAKAASSMGQAAVAGFRKLSAEMEQVKKQLEIQGNQIKNQRRGR
jgi:hypothetical protein